MRRNSFTAVKSEGGLLPNELLARIAAEDPDLPGMTRHDYHLVGRESLGEVINRSWNRLLGLWGVFQDARESRGESDPLVGLTRDRWLLPLFNELGYGRLQRSQALQIEGKSFALTHSWGATPIHLVGAGVSLDKRTAGVAGAAAAAPHSLIQEFLNRSDQHLWAFVSNGRLLRIIRDNYSLSRQAYVEFDLEAILDGELFSDFRLLWLLCHQSRVEGAVPEECWLEVWHTRAKEEGVRALDALSDGVETALEALGAGFLKHPANARLQEGLRSGALDRQDYYRELLRLAYRLIFLFVAEDRDALLDPAADEVARSRYRRFYSSQRIREMAGRRRGSPHSDLWAGLRLVLHKLYRGSPELGLPALGSFLFSPGALPWTGEAELRNEDLLGALRSLCYTHDGQLIPVNWRTLDSEELGSVYEGLLELHPKLNREAGTFSLDTAAGNERKTTGSYYTPTSLVDRLLESALEPVLARAMKSENPEQALLDLRVCDTAVGSGHFLVAAARRIAERLASVRTGEESPSPESYNQAIRDVVGRCIYGVDLNPLAAELCKVSLWMEALEPGKPLSFLDHHIQVGNSLLGATPALIRKGIPNEAFKAIEGDDKSVVSALRRQNRQERKSDQIGFLHQLEQGVDARHGGLEARAQALTSADDSTLAAVEAKAEGYQRILASPEYRRERLAADAWCAAFVWRKTEDAPPAITEDVFRQIQRDPSSVSRQVRDEVERLARKYRFFHFHLAYPEVFHLVEGGGEEREGDVTGWSGGFDVVLGNPPWERIKLQEKEWFAERAPEIAEARKAAVRKELIKTLKNDDPHLHQAFLHARRQAEGESHLVRDSGRLPLCGRGDVNTYSVFSETNRQILAPKGRMGIIVQSGVATDDTTKYFFQDLMDTRSLLSLYDFENRKKVFPAVDSRQKFCLLTVGGREVQVQEGARFAFFLHDTSELDDEKRTFTLTPEDIALLNPNTRTCPIFRTRKDAEITKKIYRRLPVLVREGDPNGNPWGVSFARLFDMSNDSEHFRTREELEKEGWILSGNVFAKGESRYVPLYEAKMIHHFDYQWATYENGKFRDVTEDEKADLDFHLMPRYWVPQGDVEARLGDRWGEDWLLGWRDICRSTDERTLITSILPRSGAGDTLLLAFPSTDPALVPCLLGWWASFACDFVVRQKIGGTHLKYHVFKQISVLSPKSFTQPRRWTGGWSLSDWVGARVSQLVGLEAGSGGTSISFDHRLRDPDDRESLRAELDATFFLLLGVERDDVEFILDTFPIVRRKDEAKFGEFRTKRLILEKYDEFSGT